MEDGANVDINGDQFVVENEDGEAITYGGTEWPTGDTASQVPEFKSGTVTYVIETDGYVMISVEGITENDYSDYYQEIVDAGFTVEKTEMTGEDFASYTASNDSSIQVNLMYTASDSTFVIQVSDMTVTSN